MWNLSSIGIDRQKGIYCYGGYPWNYHYVLKGVRIYRRRKRWRRAIHKSNSLGQFKPFANVAEINRHGTTAGHWASNIRIPLK
jgi:hypothetical protein